jgi:hypothetical protein
MNWKKILLWTCVAAILSGAVYVQATYQPHPELNANPKNPSPSSDKKRDQ